MAKSQIRQQTQETYSAATQLVSAHTEIMEAWFEQWRIQERSRIDSVFRKIQSVERRRQLA